jgi:hypothetical protein
MIATWYCFCRARTRFGPGASSGHGDVGRKETHRTHHLDLDPQAREVRSHRRRGVCHLRAGAEEEDFCASIDSQLAVTWKKRGGGRRRGRRGRRVRASPEEADKPRNSNPSPGQFEAKIEQNRAEQKGRKGRKTPTGPRHNRLEYPQVLARPRGDARGRVPEEYCAVEEDARGGDEETVFEVDARGSEGGELRGDYTVHIPMRVGRNETSGCRPAEVRRGSRRSWRREK